MNWKKLLFTGFYTGYSPIAPGTLGSILAMFLYIIEYYVFGNNVWLCNLIVVLLMICPAIKLADAGEKYFGKKDPQQVVLDEIMGYWISILLFPFNWKIVIYALLLFRIMDIIKPYPIKKMEKLKSGLGIMMDDYISGIYANITLRIIIIITGIFGISII